MLGGELPTSCGFDAISTASEAAGDRNRHCPRRRGQMAHAVRIVRSIHPPIDLFEDIAHPADWPLLVSAEQKTNPRLMESVGNRHLVPPGRRVAGPGASHLVAPFTHVSVDRPSRFSAGAYGVLYAGNAFEVALFETIHHHGRFMTRTKEAAGWASQFREIVLDVDARLHDLRGRDPNHSAAIDPDDYSASRELGAQLRVAGSDGLVYPSLRFEGGQCVGLSIPIALRIRSKGGIWIIIGMVLAWICFVISAVEPSIVWSDRIALARVPGAIDRFHNSGSASRGDRSSSSHCRGQGFDSPHSTKILSNINRLHGLAREVRRDDRS